MKNSIQGSFPTKLKNSSIKSVFSLILLTFILKLGVAFYFTTLYHCQFPNTSVGYLAQLSGDTHSYTGAMDNLRDEGSYYFWNGKRKVYAGRMPHYSVPYYLLRLFFPINVASDIFILLQILVDSIATVVLALLCFEIIKRKLAIYISYFLYLLSFNYFLYSLYLYPESFSFNLFIFFLYAFQKYWDGGKWRYTIYASIFLALIVVLKPYLIIIYIPFFTTVLLKERVLNTFNIKLMVSKLLILSTPLLLLIFPWIIRNAIVFGRFIPAQENMTAGYNYTEADFAYRRFVGAWGGSIVYWDPQSTACYFLIDHNISCTFEFPDYALTQGYNINEIENVRDDYIQLQRQYTPELEQLVVDKFDRLTDIYRKERPFMFYIGSRFLVLKNLFWHTNNQNMPINPSFTCFKYYQLIFKVFQFIIYCFALTFGFLGLILLSYKKRVSFLYLTTIILIVFFFVYIGWTEPRYFNPIYPMLLIGLTYIISRSTNKIVYSLLKANIFQQS